MNAEENKKEILNALLNENQISQEEYEKLSFHSFSTENFCYIGVRIGNSIGDELENGIRLFILKNTAEKHRLPFHFVDHGEIHSTSVSRSGALELLKAVHDFESKSKPDNIIRLHSLVEKLIENEISN